MSIDVNEAFRAERVNQIQSARDAEAARIAAAAERAADFDQRVADGKLVPVGGNAFRVNDPGSYDNGEVLTRQVEQATGRTLLLPQHGLDETTGSVALYTTTPAWHELGNVIPGGTSDVDEVLKLGGIDYDVTRRPVLFQPTSGAPARPLDGQFVTVREDTGAGLGVVGSRYEVIQNRQMFEFLQDLVDRYDVIWESAGALREGRKVFVSLRLPGTVTIDAEGVSDEIVPFIAAINSHDGSSLAQTVATPWRILCGNTERFALRDAHSRWGVRHTRNALDRVEEARRTLGLSVKYFEAFKAEEEALARTDLALAEFHAVVNELWTPPEDDAPERAKTFHANRLDTLTELYDTNAARLGRTAYAGERAITEFSDWKSSIRPTGNLRGKNLAARATAVMEGSADELKSKAHRRLMVLVRR